MVSESQYTLDLSMVSAAPGAYVLTLVAGGSSLRDTAGNPLAADASTAFVVHPWQNVSNVYDVHDDLDVAPIDVLLIINEINSKGTGPILLPATRPPFVDVNGDDSLGAIDALLVINFLNNRVSGGSGGEGEVASAGVVASSYPFAESPLGQAIRADQNLPWDVLTEFSSSVHPRRVQGVISVFPASVEHPHLSKIIATNSQPTSAAIAGRDERRRFFASNSVPRFQSDAVLGNPGSSTRMAELDDLLDLLANDVAGTKSASDLTCVR